MKLFKALGSYRKVEKHIVRLILAETLIQLINSAFMIALLVYMEKLGYKDHESAHFQKYRFLSVLALAIPIGIYIKGRNIKPLFYCSVVLVPVSALLILYSLEKEITWLIYLSHITWGAGFVFMQVGAIPFILRNASKETQTEAISLSHSTWSIAGVVTGIFFFTFQGLFPGYVDEKLLMQLFAIAGFLALFFILKISITENKNDPGSEEKISLFDYDWGIITLAMIPTTMIAVGAGLTIPFISLFFYKIHGIDTNVFSILACLALFLVSIFTVYVPHIKRKLGYKLAIPLTQSVSIICLIALASTELFSDHYLAPILAAFFYILRQPLMNMAAPMTSEVTMNYVGKKNQEMMSALTASIWSGGWFLSSWVFEQLREIDISYSGIFLITAVFYAIGVFAYHLLTLDAERKGRLN